MESTQNSELRQNLEAKSRDDLNIIAKRLRVPGYRRLKKVDLVAAILNEDRPLLLRYLSISWWDRYHNHVYGGITALGLVLAVVQMMLLEPTSSGSPSTLPAEPTEIGASDSSSTPIITPEGYIPITMEQMLAEVKSDKLTALQRDSVKKGYVGKSIQWVGSVRDVTPLWAHDPKSEIILLVAPVAPSGMFPPFITVLFPPDQRAMLEKLQDGYEVEFRATIKSFNDFDHRPSLSAGKLLRFSPGN